MAQDEQHSHGETPEERALSALRNRMAHPQPKAPEPIENADESGISAGSATGFVGMLAKRQLDGEPSVVSEIEAEAERRSRDSLQMAREVVPPVGIEQHALPPARPHWLYRLTLPVAWALAALLVIIGGWAIGALVYMHQHNAESHPPIMVPKDVAYPLIAFHQLDRPPWGEYTPASRIMAGAMLLCWPVALLLVVLARLVRKRMI